MITVIQVTPSVSRLVGGLFESVRNLSRSIHLTKRAKLMAFGCADERATEDAKYWQPLEVTSFPVVGPKQFGYAPGLQRELLRRPADIVHLHGLWRYSSKAVLSWHKRSGKPYVVSVRGMLEPWALGRSEVKKRVAARLFQTACLRHAACLHATSPQEVKSIRAAGYLNPIALIHNGVEVPADSQLTLPVDRRKIRRAFFLSRIHPVKGLLNLVEAWSQMQPPDWELTIAGPNERNHLREVRAAVKQHGLEETVRFHEEVFHEAKTRWFLESDLFVLPSFSESFGMVIGEALAHALPVITTRATPWRELEEYGCGWWIETGVDPLAAALKEATALPQDALRVMGLRGRNMVRQNYSWERIANEMLEVYEWCLGGGTPPNSIQLA